MLNTVAFGLNSTFEILLYGTPPINVNDDSPLMLWSKSNVILFLTKVQTRFGLVLWSPLASTAVFVNSILSETIKVNVLPLTCFRVF